MDEEEYSSDSSDEDYVAGNEPNDDSCDDSSGLSEDDDASGKPSNRNKKCKSFQNEEEKEEPSAEDKLKEKERKNDLFASFLADVEEKPLIKKKSGWGDILGSKKTSSDTPIPNKDKKPSPKPIEKQSVKDDTKSQTVKVTKVFEFAGEEIRVEEEVSCDSKEAIQNVPVEKSLKRPGAAGLLSFIQNKKQKLSTLEKTKLDWNSFKKDEKLEEELESHKKSKSGYLDKVDFLQRADQRQFEIERDIRMKNRSKR